MVFIIHPFQPKVKVNSGTELVMSTRPAAPSRKTSQNRSNDRLRTVLSIGQNLKKSLPVAGGAAPQDQPGGGVTPFVPPQTPEIPNVYNDQRMDPLDLLPDFLKPERFELTFVNDFQLGEKVYTGEMKNGKPDGKGLLQWVEDGRKKSYDGKFDNGNSIGQGELRSDSSKFSMVAKGTFSGNFLPVNVDAVYTQEFSKVDLRFVSAKAEELVSKPKSWTFQSPDVLIADADVGVVQSMAYGTEKGAVLRWKGTALDDVDLSLFTGMHRGSRLHGGILWTPPAARMLRENLEPSAFAGVVKLYRGVAEWESASIQQNYRAQNSDGLYTDYYERVESWPKETFGYKGLKMKRRKYINDYIKMLATSGILVAALLPTLRAFAARNGRKTPERVWYDTELKVLAQTLLDRLKLAYDGTATFVFGEGLENTALASFEITERADYSIAEEENVRIVIVRVPLFEDATLNPQPRPDGTVKPGVWINEDLGLVVAQKLWTVERDEDQDMFLPEEWVILTTLELLASAFPFYNPASDSVDAE